MNYNEAYQKYNKLSNANKKEYIALKGTVALVDFMEQVEREQLEREQAVEEVVVSGEQPRLQKLKEFVEIKKVDVLEKLEQQIVTEETRKEKSTEKVKGEVEVLGVLKDELIKTKQDYKKAIAELEIQTKKYSEACVNFNLMVIKMQTEHGKLLFQMNERIIHYNKLINKLEARSERRSY